MASDQEEFLEELVGEGMMSQEEANGFWWQNWEEQTRATVGEELEEFVESGEMTHEEAGILLEETIRMRRKEAMRMRIRMTIRIRRRWR